MYRMVLPLLLTVALTFGGCAAGQNMSQKTEITGQSSDMPGKKNMYMVMDIFDIYSINNPIYAEFEDYLYKENLLSSDSRFLKLVIWH